jgi:chemotaxis response regulator CheB
MANPIKVFLVEDSLVAMGVYSKLLETSPLIEIVGKATDGIQALSMIPNAKPDVICTDLQMPNMDGLELIKQLMAKYPVPILVLSNAVQSQDIDNIYDVLQAGAIDVMPKPQSAGGENSEEFKQQLIIKIRVLATKTVSQKPLQ